MYLKNALVIEQFAKVDTIVFDKTGTITTNKKSNIVYEGKIISDENYVLIKNVLRTSNHPLSRMLYDFLPNSKRIKIDDFEEITGKGILASIENKLIQIGSAVFVGNADSDGSEVEKTALHVKIDNVYYGQFNFQNQYRDSLATLFLSLNKNYNLKVLSGDNDGERANLEAILPKDTEFIFNQKPEQKLEFIKNLQQNGQNVMMVGDGLNDAGALAQSNVGISISENVNVFSPACDAILDASEFSRLNYFLKLSQKSIFIIKMSFVLSLLYNVVGLSFAVTGNLLPLVAAIIMPLSTITIVSFVTMMSNYFSNSNLK
jgi:Cu+-exporting ATPase